MNFTDFCSTDIRFMNMEQIKHFLCSLEFKNIVLVMSKSACQRFQWTALIEKMREKYGLLWIDDPLSYPTQETLAMGLSQTRGCEAEAIIAIGGGSSIDFAKGLKAFWGSVSDCSADALSHALKNGEVAPSKNIQLIAAPTTAGTGSELTKWATIWDHKKECKYSIEHDSLKPDLALIVPEFSLAANRELSIFTGLDSLSHAIEAYWSKKSNPLARTLAIQSATLTVDYLPRLLEEPDELEYREKQCLACVMSALSFSMTKTTACHSISYPLTMDYHIPHGLAVSMTLASVAHRNSGTYEGERELMEVFRPYGGIQGFLDSNCFNGISFYLSDYGITKGSIAAIVERSFTLGRMDNNPAALTPADVTEMLNDIMYG